MTREEAIKELSYIADEMPSMECADWKKAISVAIKALEQEPFKPMVEIDLYSVIKQKYIEREVLDKIRAEIIDEKDFAYADFERYKEEVLGAEPDELPDDDFRFGMERAIEIIDRYMNDKCGKGCDFCEHTSECMPSKE